MRLSWMLLACKWPAPAADIRSLQFMKQLHLGTECRRGKVRMCLGLSRDFWQVKGAGVILQTV